MRRHASNHTKRRITEQEPRRRRTAPRASQACEACALDKARCDNHICCQRCQKKDIPCIRPSYSDSSPVVQGRPRTEQPSVQSGSGLVDNGLVVDNSTAINEAYGCISADVMALWDNGQHPSCKPSNLITYSFS